MIPGFRAELDCSYLRIQREQDEIKTHIRRNFARSNVATQYSNQSGHGCGLESQRD